MTLLLELIRRKPLLWTALLVALVKSLQLAIDSMALFCFDSTSMILNALGMAFLPERSYIYGWLLRIFALPFHSLRAVVAMQVAMGGFIAWLLAFVLIRFLETRGWIAVGAALAFSFDPVQILHEHMVMTETTTLLVAAVYLVVALDYLKKPAAGKLALLAFVAAVLVGMRLVYLPVVIGSAVLLPLFAGLRPRRLVALAFAVSCSSTLLFQLGYRQLTGHLAGREPAYHYIGGFILAAGAAPLARPGNIDDPRVAEAVAEQSKSDVLLSDPEQRDAQMFGAQGLVHRLISKFNGDQRAAEQAAAHFAVRAIEKDPIGFLRLGLLTYYRYWKGIPYLRLVLPWENGSPPGGEVRSFDLEIIRFAFGVDASQYYLLQTPTRRYHILARIWYVFLLLSPYVGGIAIWLARGNRTGVAFLFAWSCLLLASTSVGAITCCYRYLHPFSFTGLAAVAVLLDLRISRIRGGETASREPATPADSIAYPAATASLLPPGTS